MVAGAYTKSNYSRSRPVILKCAPSHAERPQARGAREKGKGWQRSKSSIYDYGSEFYFSEEKTPRHRRAQSSMSGRRTEKYSSLYEIECPAKQPRKRRASLEAIVMSAKTETAAPCTQVPAGPPIQKRVMTVHQKPDRDCLTPNRAIAGFTQISKDRTLQRVEISEREGPEARAYTPKYEAPGATQIPFPYAESEQEQKTYECRQRFMHRLIYTELFKERQGEVVDEDTSFLNAAEGDWPIWSGGPPKENSPANRYLNELRIELKESDVPEDRLLDGRVVVDLKEPTTIEAIDIDVNKTLAMTTPDGRVNIDSKRDRVPMLRLLPGHQPRLNVPGVAPPHKSNATNNTTTSIPPPSNQQNTPTQLPNDIVLAQAYPNKISLPAGRNYIPFQLYVPENQVPSFTYASLKGPTVINNYSAEATLTANGTTEKTGRVPIRVPALGNRNIGYKEDDKNYEILLNNKYFTNNDGFQYALGYSTSDTGHEKPRDVKARVFQVVKCPQIGVNESRPVLDLGIAKMNSGKSSTVLDEYRKNSRNPPAKDDWDGSAQDEVKTTNFTTPTVSAGGFTCDYYLEITAGDEKYIGPVIKVDRYTDKELRRNDISSSSKRNDFRVPL